MNNNRFKANYRAWESAHPRVVRLRQGLPKNNQKGFTLIELLVVISILGILAAVVTMSMVGITKIAQDNAKATEKQTVQVAYDTMLADQGIPSGSECPPAGSPGGSLATATSDMSSFGSTTKWSTAVAGDHNLLALAPKYLRTNTRGVYWCDAANGGLIVQSAYVP